MIKAEYLLLMKRFRWRLDWVLLKLGVFWTQIQLWRLKVDIAILIALKRLIQRFGGGEDA
jgi:hypothetical protein